MLIFSVMNAHEKKNQDISPDVLLLMGNPSYPSISQTPGTNTSSISSYAFHIIIRFGTSPFSFCKSQDHRQGNFPYNAKPRVFITGEWSPLASTTQQFTLLVNQSVIFGAEQNPEFELKENSLDRIQGDKTKYITGFCFTGQTGYILYPHTDVIN